MQERDDFRSQADEMRATRDVDLARISSMTKAR